MRISYGIWTVATVLGLLTCGCSKEPEGDFREALDSGNAVPDPVKTAANRKPNKRQPVVAIRPKPRVRPFEVSVVASLGFGGRTVLSDTFRFSAERRLPPAIGGASTLVLLTKVDDPVQNTAAIKKAKPREVKLLVPEKTFRKEGDALRVSYDDINLLKVLNMEPVTTNAAELMPAWMKGLDGQKIRIRGFMSPAFRASGLRAFHLGRDNKACCYPSRAKIYDLFRVILKRGTTTRYIQNRPFDVVGTFQIRPWVVDGQILRIYRIVDAQIVK